MESYCDEHKKQTQEIIDIKTTVTRIDANVVTLLTTTTESKTDRKWIRKELNTIWGLLVLIAVALVGGFIKVFFTP